MSTSSKSNNNRNTLRGRKNEVSLNQSSFEEPLIMDDDEIELQNIVFQSRWKHIEEQRKKLTSQKTFIRQERRRLLLQKALLQSEVHRYSVSKDPDWFCEASFPKPSERRIVIEVGGKLFETTARVVSKDPSSLLAAFAADDSPLKASEIGCFRVDRDWWSFRHILNFLRDGILPKKTKTLKLLYKECDFWKLESLKRAIEERFLNVYRKSSSSEKESRNQEHHWWEVSPPWWKQESREMKEKIEDRKTGVSVEASEDEWWTGKKYKGIDFSKKEMPGKQLKSSATSRAEHISSTWNKSKR